MALHNYAEMDEGDFYGQGFKSEGLVSVWLGLGETQSMNPNIDVLQDLCGVGYYDIDKQDANAFDDELVSVRSLVNGMSYSDSFIEDVCDEAAKRGVLKARWAIFQYDFEYDPDRVIRDIADDPVFLGAFPYSIE